MGITNKLITIIKTITNKMDIKMGIQILNRTIITIIITTPAIIITTITKILSIIKTVNLIQVNIPQMEMRMEIIINKIIIKISMITIMKIIINNRVKKQKVKRIRKMILMSEIILNNFFIKQVYFISIKMCYLCNLLYL